MAEYGKSRGANVPFSRRVKKAINAINPVNIVREAKDVVVEEIDGIKHWNKTADPRTKNFFAGAAAITPGFVAAVSGLVMVANNYGVARDCNAPDPAKDPTTQVDSAVCELAEDRVQDGGNLIIGGLAGMAGPGALFVVRDSRLKKLQGNGASQRGSSEAQVRPPISR